MSGTTEATPYPVMAVACEAANQRAKTQEVVDGRLPDAHLGDEFTYQTRPLIHLLFLTPSPPRQRCSSFAVSPREDCFCSRLSSSLEINTFFGLQRFCLYTARIFLGA